MDADDRSGECISMNNSKPKDEKDNNPTRVWSEEDLEEKHQRLLILTEEVLKKYHASYRQMISELRPSHLDEFADVLMERQKHVLQDRDDLIKEMGEKLVCSLSYSLDKFWEEYDVAKRLADLEMLKEQYRKFEGNTWNVLQMNPLQRTLPLRMRYKKNKLHYLEKQLAYQNEKLKNLLEINRKERSFIEEIEDKRKAMLMNITRCTKDMEQINSLTVQSTCDVISKCV